MNDCKLLQTVDDVIGALGGVAAVKTLTECSTSTIWNWKNSGRFPSDTYVVMNAALAMRGKSAPVSLWRMRKPVAAE
jgi:hypothetical protein